MDGRSGNKRVMRLIHIENFEERQKGRVEEREREMDVYRGNAILSTD